MDVLLVPAILIVVLLLLRILVKSARNGKNWQYRLSKSF